MSRCPYPGCTVDHLISLKEKSMPQPPTLTQARVVDVTRYLVRDGSRRATDEEVVDVTLQWPMSEASRWFPELRDAVTVGPNGPAIVDWMTRQSLARQRVIKAAEEWYDRMEGVYGATIQETVAGTWTEDLFDAVRSMRAKGEGSDAW